MGHGEFEGAKCGLEVTGLKAISVAVTLDVSLVGCGADVSFAFEEHGGVHEDFGDFGEGTFKAVGKKKVDE